MLQRIVLSELMCRSFEKQCEIGFPYLLNRCTRFTLFFLQLQLATVCHRNCLPESLLEHAVLLSKDVIFSSWIRRGRLKQ
jgi:hypothetical protein